MTSTTLNAPPNPVVTTGWPRRLRTASFVFAGLVGVVAVIVAVVVLLRPAPPSSAEIRLAMARNRWDDAIRLAEARLAVIKEDYETRLRLGECYQRKGDSDAALWQFAAIPESAGDTARAARLASASMLIHWGQLERAERELNAMGTDATPDPHRDELAVRVGTLSGQRYITLAPLYRLIAEPGEHFMHLIYLANPDNMPAPPDDLFAKMFSVGDPLGLLGAAKTAAAIGRRDQAYEIIERIRTARPELVETAFFYGSMLLDDGRLDEFDALQADLPAGSDDHPGIWFNRGRRAHDSGDSEGAIRCYWETLRRQPNHDRATYQLGQLLIRQGEVEKARHFIERSGRLSRLIELSARLFEDRGSIIDIWECAKLNFELGRHPECRAWCEYLLESEPGHRQARALHRQLLSLYSVAPPPLLPEQDLAAKFSFARYAVPQLRSAPAQPSLEKPDRIAPAAFRDDAQALGIVFRYHNADDPTTPGKRMVEYTGGGVAAFDFDRDGWCDILFTQGAYWPPVPNQRDHLDALYWNRSGAGFQEIAKLAGVVDGGFGQGACAADYDHDGFPDLYIANIDGNRLFHNNGDGTFDDVTAQAGLGHVHWTTSCAMADFNGDGIVDVYDVTFLEGEDVFTKICVGKEGIPRSCAPAGFNAAPDHVYLGNGDGTFRDITQAGGFDVPDGDGLGIVVADYDNSRKLGVFIANDGRPNFYFAPQTSAGDPSPRWLEYGILSGLAFNDEGVAQASMGVGAGDVNNDGLLDLAVTTFYHESTMLFVNQSGSLFSDRARTLGLREPTLQTLGFGCQFLDADLDGWEDLLLMNGHVDDFAHKNIPYKMAPQFFRNNRGRFEEAAPESLGPLFSTPRLGRGLARWDWNRDGLPDAAVSHIDDPVALFTNTTATAGHSLRLRLVGTAASRDPIGTRVEFHVGEQHFHRQLTAGDGYQASNERLVHCGFENRTPVTVTVRWPDGAEQTWNDVAVDQELVVIQGSRDFVPLSR